MGNCLKVDIKEIGDDDRELIRAFSSMCDCPNCYDYPICDDPYLPRVRTFPDGTIRLFYKVPICKKDLL